MCEKSRSDERFFSPIIREKRPPVPNALAAGNWLLGLYKLWTGQWGREDLRGWGFLVLICGSTSFPMCIHSTGPWICMGVSLLLGIGAILYGKGPSQPLD